ncbi:MAG: tRNA uridine-5-carboxymethylaminomethyl(34) synthesis enzyme MnmG [Candidatus Omnitrophota bacterium]|nr:tRNA uridine-5-carboxymethylaminomethyl(34) synthesis enzyme MnmG [Candidatus Omnitrophota bacterium]MDZ4243273.1 tRNA uridine-5-carboxymethylaminomethyl(34) synthesis enzyme MnmG [Candidatus Omnitrophota bacterium]
MSHHRFDCVVIGAGHAGVEAALAASRMGCKTAMVTLFVETIGQMSCNPAIGGVGKGQLVKEIDALGGEMGLAADRTGIQFRQLNASKGQAVRSSRCQSDRKQYKLYMQKAVRDQDNLTVIADEASEILVSGGQVTGLRTVSGLTLETPAVVVTTGTFLKGRIHVGPTITPGGRIGEPASVRLADNIKDLGFEVVFFKTGTPPRLDGKTIDFSRMVIQHSDERPIPFSFRTPFIPREQKLLPCYLTHTGERTHEVIRNNFHLSPMYSGQIQATGVRYCPSIEDKLKKFADKSHHLVFLEPEGLDTDEYYPNGISTGLPAEVQEEFVRTIPGLENVRFVRHGYSIEHGVIPPTSITPFMETKTVKGLYLAGQINGTTGYEEAGAQGLLAGINAALRVKGEEPFVLGRHESYIGVLMDDLTTKGTDEPYRMFTSRVEHRLIVREDNADKRLASYGRKFGLLSGEDFAKVERKYAMIGREVEHLRSTRVYPGSPLDEILEANNSQPLRQPILLSDLLKRPEIRYHMISAFDGLLKDFPPEVIDQVEYEIKYEGFIHRALKNAEKFKHLEAIRIPGDINYDGIGGLSIEIRQKMKKFSPLTLGQANRISGVTPAAITILMIHLRKLTYQRKISRETPGLPDV